MICFGFGSKAMNTIGEAVRVLVIQVELNLGISLVSLPFMNFLTRGSATKNHSFVNPTGLPVESVDELFSNLTFLPVVTHHKPN